MKMHVLSGGRVRMRKSIYLPDADRSETIELPVSCDPAAPCAGQRAVRYRLPSRRSPTTRRRAGAASLKVMTPIMPPGDNVLTGTRRRRPRARRHRRGRVLAPASRPLRLQRVLQARDRASCTPGRSRRRARRAPKRRAISPPSGISRRRSDAIDGERDLFGDGRIVLIPLPGHTPGSIGALVAARKVSGTFLLASDTVSLRVDPRHRHHSAQHLERRGAGEVARRDPAHRGARRHRAVRPRRRRNGRRCARAPTPMNDAPEIHARPKIVGARIKRTEDPRLLTGLGAYTDDRQVMRVLHVAFRRSDQAHARIRSIDCAAARAAPGVVAVLTAEDLSAAVQPLVATSRMTNYYADADSSARAPQGALCRRAGRRRHRREPLSRRGRRSN